MNPDVKEKWTTALRSGDYEQGTNTLVRDEKYCCLGVLCDLAVKAGVIDGPVIDQYGDMVFDGADAVLPNSVMRWSGMETPSGEYDFNVSAPGAYRQLSADNDNGSSFLKIADIIEEKF